MHDSVDLLLGSVDPYIFADPRESRVYVGASQLDGAILVVGATDGCMPQTREHLTLTKQLGLKHLVVFINKCDAADAEMIELVEMEIRELLEEMGFPEENSPIVKGSALAALEGSNEELGKKAIEELMNVVDTSIPTPVRDLDVPFLMPIDHVHDIKGRGCVLTGRLERGKLKVNYLVIIRFILYSHSHRLNG